MLGRAMQHAFMGNCTVTVVAAHSKTIPALRWLERCSWKKTSFQGNVTSFAPKVRHELCRRNCGSQAALSFDISPTTIIVTSSALSYIVLRAFVYFRMQYIIAAMLNRHVPRGGAKVLDLSLHEGRNLHYYPADTVQVLTVASKSNIELLQNQAKKAGVPIEIKSKALNALGLPSNSMDAVVSVYCLCDLPDREVASVLREAVRVLKPGKPFIFVENIGAKDTIVRAAQSVLEMLSRFGGNRGALTRDPLSYIQKIESLENLEHEEVFAFQDPHIVGRALKKLPDSSDKRKTSSKRSQG